MIKAIIFDMDGVLIDSMKYHISSWKEALNNAGFKANYEELALYEGMSYPETIEKISKNNNKTISKAEAEKIHQDKIRIIEEIFHFRTLTVYQSLLHSFQYLLQHIFLEQFLFLFFVLFAQVQSRPKFLFYLFS